jgi:hypothetical protein
MKYLVAAGIVGLLAYGGWYFLSPLFVIVEVDDALPIAATEGTMPSGAENLSPEDRLAMEAAHAAANATSAPLMRELMPSTQLRTPTPAPVLGTVGHPATGTVRIIETSNGLVIRYENFETINGPQLNLYLAKDLDANEYIDLGPVRGTRGNINYTVPDNVDLSEYRYVLYWCVPFGVLFNYADLQPEPASA